MSRSSFSATHHPTPKLSISTGTLPPYISPTQPPTKKQPFGTINSVAFVRSTTLVLPEELYQLIITKLDLQPQVSPNSPSQPQSSILRPKYAKLITPLALLLRDPFLSQHIKRTGSNILALSEGTPGVNDTFRLCNGGLTLDLDKDVYERLGLQGSIVKNTGARKHVKTRWRVEVDLKAASSLAGKKGFEKLRSAAEENGVIGMGKTWLMADVEGLGEGAKLQGEEMRHLHPLECDALVEEGKAVNGVLVPQVLRTGDVDGYGEEEWWEVLEWIDLVALGSPRVTADDSVDSHVSRYSVPEPRSTENVRILKWDGLMSSDWVTRLLIELTKASSKAQSQCWLVLSVAGHSIETVGGVDGYSIVLHAGGIGVDRENGDAMEVDESIRQGESQGQSRVQRFMCFQVCDSGVS